MSNKTTTFVKDSQSRVTRYGVKAFQLIDGVRCFAFAHATKKGNTLVVSQSFDYCINAAGESLAGTYKILSTGSGNIAEVVCEKNNFKIV